jgi:putative ABC transport system permease protein
MMGIFFRDSIDYMIDVQYRLVQSEDLSATFVEPTSRKALFELLRLPGVEYGEAFRSVPVRLRYEQRSYRTAIQGLQSDSRLYRLLDADLVPLVLPAEGLLLTDYLADLLGAKVGDTLTVETLEGARPIRQVRLAGVNSQLLGVSASMRIQALNRMMREGSAISGVRLKVDRERENEVYRAIKQMPRIAGSEVQRKSVESLYETMGEQVLIFASITTLLAATVAFGVIYNSARITLSERERELASLRVLGYTRGEAAWILLGEMAILTLVALPLGAVGGWALCRAFIQGAQTDLFRIPLVLEPRTYAYGALVVLVCSVVSGMIVWRRVNRLDLVGVLKTRE